MSDTDARGQTHPQPLSVPLGTLPTTTPKSDKSVLVLRARISPETWLLHQLELLGGVAQQLSYGTTQLQRLVAVLAMPEGVRVTRPRAAAGGPAVQPAPSLALDRRGPARAAAAGPGTPSRAQVHGPGLPLQEVDPAFCRDPHPGDPAPNCRAAAPPARRIRSKAIRLQD